MDKKLKPIIDSFKLPDNYRIETCYTTEHRYSFALQVSIYDKETAQVGLQYAYIKFKALETMDIRSLLADMIANVEYQLKVHLDK